MSGSGANIFPIPINVVFYKTKTYDTGAFVAHGSVYVLREHLQLQLKSWARIEAP